MRLEHFRLLRVPAQRDSPFCYEVLVAQQPGPSVNSPPPHNNSGVETVADFTGNTLFLTHMPAGLSTEGLCMFLQELSGVPVEEFQEKTVARELPPDATRFSPLDKHGSTAPVIRLLYVSFESSVAIARVLAHTKALKAAPDTVRAAAGNMQQLPGDCYVPMHVSRLGHWLGEFAGFLKSPAALQSEVDFFMERYDLKKRLESQRMKQRQQTDEEGFTLVLGDAVTAKDGTTFRCIRRREAFRSVAVKSRDSAAVITGTGTAAASGHSSTNLFFQQQAASAAAAGKSRGETGSNEHSWRRRRRRGGVEGDFYRFQKRERKQKEFLEKLQMLAEEEKNMKKKPMIV